MNLLGPNGQPITPFTAPVDSIPLGSRSVEVNTIRDIDPNGDLSFAAIAARSSEWSKTAVTLACVRNLVWDTSGLPIDVKEKDANGIVRDVPDLPWMVKPNPEQVWKQMMQQFWGSFYTQGAGILVRYPLYEFASIDDEMNVTVPYVYYARSPSRIKRVARENSDGSYSSSLEYHDLKTGHNIPFDDVLYLPWLETADGSVVTALGSLESQVALNNLGREHALAHESNNGRSLLGIKTTTTMTEAELLEARRKYQAALAAGSILVFDNLEPVDMKLSDADSQFVEKMQWTVADIAMVFRMPLHKLGIHGAEMKYNNLSQENVKYYQESLLPPILILQDMLRLWLPNPQSQFVKFNERAVVRGDIIQEMEAARTGIQGSIYTPNDVRQSFFDLPPIEGEGDQLQRPENTGLMDGVSKQQAWAALAALAKSGIDLEVAAKELGLEGVQYRQFEEAEEEESETQSEETEDENTQEVE